MGDRVSIRFVNPKAPEWGRQSVVLFSHWGGIEFAEDAQKWADALADERSGSMLPLDRIEPDTVIVEYIHELTKNEKGRVGSGLYLGATENDGDNSDNGHHDIILGRTADER